MMEDFKKRFRDFRHEISVEKAMRNTFGKFDYRTKPMILEALKPFEKKYDILIFTTTELVSLEGRIFVKGTARAQDMKSDAEFTAVSYAELQKAGTSKMNEPQLTGSSDTYATKYALSNLLNLDDNLDPDANESDVKVVKMEEELNTLKNKNVPKEEPKQEPKVEQKSNTGDVLSFRASLLTVMPADLTVEKANDLMKQAIELNNDVPSINIIKKKAEVAGLVYNEETKTFKGE